MVDCWVDATDPCSYDLWCLLPEGVYLSFVEGLLGRGSLVESSMGKWHGQMAFCRDATCARTNHAVLIPPC